MRFELLGTEINNFNFREFASINKINKNLPNESVKNCNLINLMLNF